MNRVYLFFATIIISVSIVSCTKDSFTRFNQEIDSVYENTEQAMIDFSVILSKAVYNEPELRSFLKEEALKSFDRDYDVFYPWTKYSEVRDGLTFEDILKMYDSNNHLHMIEKTIPLLNILVPDWSWISTDCFSVKTWNTEISEVGVGYRSQKTVNDIYANGELRISVPAGAFPDFPVLIIKENERMKVNTNSTKGTLSQYEFVDPYFDASDKSTTKGDGVVTEIFDYQYVDTGDVVPVSSLSGRLRTVYGETNGIMNFPQRDHIYYNMNAQRDTGVVDYDYHEKIMKLRFTTPYVSAIFDDPINSSSTGNDCKLIDYWLNKKNTDNKVNKTWYTYEQLALMDWGEGAIELKFDVYANSQKSSFSKTLTFEDIFFVKRVYQIREENWLGGTMYRHYFVEQQDLQPKWMNINIDLFTWDLSEYPTSYQIVIREYDKGNTREITQQKTFSYATNFKVTANVSPEIVKVGWEFGATNTMNQTITYNESYNEEDDELTSFWIQYADNFILSVDDTCATLRKYSLGDIELIIMPEKI